MTTRPMQVLRALVAIAVVVAVAAAIGLAIGRGASELNDDDVPLGGPAQASDTRQPGADRPSGGASKPAVSVLSAVFAPAATASGRRRQRARTIIRIRVINRTRRTVTTSAPRLRVAGRRISVDPNAGDAAGDMLGPIEPGERATGTLRFETAGTATRRLRTARRARLEVFDRVLRLALKPPAR